MAERMWRVVAIYRVITMIYASILIIRDHQQYLHPAGGLAVGALIIFWTSVTVVAYARPGGRQRWLIVADVLVTAVLVVSTRWVDSPARIAHGFPTLPSFWAASPILACAVAYGPWAGITAALVIAGADYGERPHLSLENPFSNIVLLLIAGGIGGYIVRLGVQAEEAVAGAARKEAAIAERERIARDIHDSVLQVLTRVSSRGRALGGEAAELGQLAAEQESALRRLVAGNALAPASASADPPLPPSPVETSRAPHLTAATPASGPSSADEAAANPASAPSSAGQATATPATRRRPGRASRPSATVPSSAGQATASPATPATRRRPGRPPVAAVPGAPVTAAPATPRRPARAGRPPADRPAQPADLADLRNAIEPFGDPRVTVSSPASPVPLPATAVAALAAATAAALDNVRQHAGPQAQAWVLVEDTGRGVRVSIRDDGAGFPNGRLTQAATAGRLGVSHSIVGRIREAGGTACVTSAPGQGTEVELAIPRTAPPSPRAHRGRSPDLA